MNINRWHFWQDILSLIETSLTFTFILVKSCSCFCCFSQFCRLFASTVRQCQSVAMQKLETDGRWKKQNFGSQSYSPPKAGAPSDPTAVEVAAAHRADSDSSLKKGTAHALIGIYSKFREGAKVWTKFTHTPPSCLYCTIWMNFFSQIV